MVEEPQAEDEIVAGEVHLADVRLNEFDLGRKWESLGPGVDGDDIPSTFCRPVGELSVTGTEVDASTRRDEAE